MPQELIRFGLISAISALLYACGIIVPGDPNTNVSCPNMETSTEGQLCGKAIRNILGPRDELVRSVPLEQPDVLVVPIKDVAHNRHELGVLDTDPAQLFAKLKGNPSAQRILTDGRGGFSASLEAGEYALCASYAAPWALSVGCTMFSISISQPTKILIIFSPMAGLSLQPVN